MCNDMIKIPDINLAADAPIWADVVHRIVAISHPQRIILFGSRARGVARPDSDVDLLVIADSQQPRCKRSGPLYGSLRDIPIAMDILVYTPGEVREWTRVPQALVTTAVREGKVLYEKPC